MPRTLALLPLLLACRAPIPEKGGSDTGSSDTSDSGDTSDTSDTSDTADTSETSDTSETDTGSATLCADLGLSTHAWQDAEDDASLGALAADFTLETTEGPWTLSKHWSGCEVYLFIPSQPNQATGWPDDLWGRKNDTRDLFDSLPRNTQLFFIASERSDEDQAAAFAELQEGLDLAESGMDEETLAWWTPRIHLVTGRDSDQPGWLGETLKSPGWGVGIDRYQTIRYIGSFADPGRYSDSAGWFAPNLSLVQWEAVAYDAEAGRQDQLDADGATVVNVFDGDVCSGNAYADVTLPDASALAEFDTVTLDLTMNCQGDGEYGDCPAWDYMAYLFACDMPEEDNPYAATSCQPYVAETLGACVDVSDGTACRADADCTDADGATGTCKGYIAATAADTLAGACSTPTGTESSGTYTCNSEGTGYGDLSCPCGTEVGRWITTYHRQGRWIYDTSAYLPLYANMAAAGKQTFRFETSGPYELTLDLRFSNQAKDARPEETTYLFAGGGIYEGSNATYSPVTVFIPADATKVELATVISGHGSDANYCGEFCDMSHYFEINGDAANAVVRDFPEAGTRWGCTEQVVDGAIPNQYGTWWYGRAGWCPGMQVPTVMSDITDQIVPGADNTFLYYALFDGAEYTGYSTNRMNAWLVVSR